MFNFKKKSEKGEKDKDAKDSKKEEKRRKEKDRKSRAERTLSGRDMAGLIASSRGNEGNTQPVVKREKHGLFHGLKRHDRKSQDFAETFDNSHPNGQTTSLGEDQNGGQSVFSRVNAFEQLNYTPSEQAGNAQNPTGNLQNGSDFQDSRTSGNKKDSLPRGSEIKKVQARTYDLNLQRPSGDNGTERASYERLLSTETKPKHVQSTPKPIVEPLDIKPTKVQAVMSENTDGFNDITAKGPSSKPPVAPKYRYNTPSSPTYNSSLVVTPGRKTSSKSRHIDVLPPSERALENSGVSLVLPAVKPAGEGLARDIKLQRQSNGGFGFALRRSATSDSKEIYLAEPVAEAYATCLLPGDKLLEVNGHNVENLSREKIVALVASSGSEVQLKVVPVPELAELTVRSGLDGGRVHVDETFIRSGSLARSGSKRIKKKVKICGFCLTQ